MSGCGLCYLLQFEKGACCRSLVWISGSIAFQDFVSCKDWLRRNLGLGIRLSRLIALYVRAMDWSLRKLHYFLEYCTCRPASPGDPGRARWAFGAMRFMFGEIDMVHTATLVCGHIRKASAATFHRSFRDAGRASRNEVKPATPVVFLAGLEERSGEQLERALCAMGWKVQRTSAPEVRLSREDGAVTPSCLVVDVTDPQASELLFQGRLEMAVVCITDEASVATTVLAMKAGALDVLAKPIQEEALMRAVESALEHSAARLAQEEEICLLRERYALLTPRERQVMALVVTGKLNKQIGGDLGISEITVKAHRGRVMRKMNVRTLVDLLKAAAKIETGTVDLEKDGACQLSVREGQSLADLGTTRWSGRLARIAASPQAHVGVKRDGPMSRLGIVG